MIKLLIHFIGVLIIVPAFAGTDPIKITFVGDIMLDELPGKYIKQGKDPFKDFKKIFGSSDLVVGNLESAISYKKGKAEKKPYTFKANPRVIPVLKKYFSAVSLANNHSFDYGENVFIDTMNLLRKNELKFFGAGNNIFEAHEPIIFFVKGKKIAILGYNEFYPRSFEALSDRPGVAWSEDDYVKEGIARAKNYYGADYIITFPHWGFEQEKTASKRQNDLARLMIDSGADAVIGGHPHVTQNIEIYKQKPIFYSLGNFVFNGFSDEDSNTGWIVVLTINENEITWLIHEAKLNHSGIPKYSRTMNKESDEIKKILFQYSK